MEQSYFEVLRPGINSTFQDKGRFGVQYMGLAPGGAMDYQSFLPVSYTHLTLPTILRV